MYFPKINQRFVLYVFLSILLGSALAVSAMYHILSLMLTSSIKLIIFSAVLFSILIGFVLRRWIDLKFYAYPVKSRIILLAGAILAGGWFVFAIPLVVEIHRRRDILLFFSDALTLSFLFFLVSVWLFARPVKHNKRIEIPRWTWLSYSIPIILVWILFLLAYWPGSLSYDSIYQWEQMVTFKFNDWHPVFHTLTNWLITRIWYSPAAIALTQIIAMGSVLGWGLVEQRRFGTPRWLPWFTILVIVAIPSNGLIVITLWKDVFYSIAILALTVLVFKITMSQGKWIQQRNALFLLSITSALVALFRHNGAPVAFGTLACLLISYRAFWGRFLAALVLTFAIWLGIRWPIYNALGVDKMSAMSSQPGVGMALVHLIARYTNTDTHFSPEERMLLIKIRPEERWPYECHLETDLFFTKLNWANLKHYETDLAMLSAKLIYRHPKTFVDHVICTSSFIFQITQTPDSLYEPIETGIYPNNFGIVRKSKLVALKNIIDQSPNQSNQSFNWLFWRVPFWGYLFLSGIIVYGVRSKIWKIVLVFVPVFLNMIPFAFMAVLQSFRYVYPTFLAGILMSGFFLLTDTYPEVE